MDLRIEKLREKYWAGETTQEEEQELKAYFQQYPYLQPDDTYFRFLRRKQNQEPVYPFSHPGRKVKPYWWSVAAAVLVLFLVGLFSLQNDGKPDYAVQDPDEAFEITKASLMMISEGLNKGKTYSSELNKINKAKTIVK
jgi:hypothetical protein